MMSADVEGSPATFFALPFAGGIASVCALFFLRAMLGMSAVRRDSNGAACDGEVCIHKFRAFDGCMAWRRGRSLSPLARACLFFRPHHPHSFAGLPDACHHRLRRSTFSPVLRACATVFVPVPDVFRYSRGSVQEPAAHAEIN